jgi:hypothetical protein
MSRPRGRPHAGLLLALACFAALAQAAPPPDPTEPLQARYARLLVRHRPDLAARWGAHDRAGGGFVPLTESSLAAHVRSLETLLAGARALPASPRADTLRARLELELAQCREGGALRSDPFTWLDIVEAAVRTAVTSEPPGGCRQVQRATLELRRIPEALRSGAILMRGSRPPEPVAFERRLTEVEQLFREDLPARTRACKEARRLAEFVEADTLAAASLMDFRHRLLPGP